MVVLDGDDFCLISEEVLSMTDGKCCGRGDFLVLISELDRVRGQELNSWKALNVVCKDVPSTRGVEAKGKDKL